MLTVYFDTIKDSKCIPVCPAGHDIGQPGWTADHPPPGQVLLGPNQACGMQDCGHIHTTEWADIPLSSGSVPFPAPDSL